MRQASGHTRAEHLAARPCGGRDETCRRRVRRAGPGLSRGPFEPAGREGDGRADRGSPGSLARRRGQWIAARMRRRPPQGGGHSRTSRANTRRISSAQGRRRGLPGGPERGARDGLAGDSCDSWPEPLMPGAGKAVLSARCGFDRTSSGVAGGPGPGVSPGGSGGGSGTTSARQPAQGASTPW